MAADTRESLVMEHSALVDDMLALYQRIAAACLAAGPSEDDVGRAALAFFPELVAQYGRATSISLRSQALDRPPTFHAGDVYMTLGTVMTKEVV